MLKSLNYNMQETLPYFESRKQYLHRTVNRWRLSKIEMKYDSIYTPYYKTLKRSVGCSEDVVRKRVKKNAKYVYDRGEFNYVLCSHSRYWPQYYFKDGVLTKRTWRRSRNPKNTQTKHEINKLKKQKKIKYHIDDALFKELLHRREKLIEVYVNDIVSLVLSETVDYLIHIDVYKSEFEIFIERIPLVFESIYTYSKDIDINISYRELCKRVLKRLLTVSA